MRERDSRRFIFIAAWIWDPEDLYVIMLKEGIVLLRDTFCGIRSTVMCSLIPGVELLYFSAGKGPDGLFKRQRDLNYLVVILIRLIIDNKYFSKDVF